MSSVTNINISCIMFCSEQCVLLPNSRPTNMINANANLTWICCESLLRLEARTIIAYQPLSWFLIVLGTNNFCFTKKYVAARFSISRFWNIFLARLKTGNGFRLIFLHFARASLGILNFEFWNVFTTVDPPPLQYCRSRNWRKTAVLKNGGIEKRRY